MTDAEFRKVNTLWTEGNWDKHFFLNLFKIKNVRYNFNVKDEDGESNLLSRLSVKLTEGTDSWLRLGYVLDADVDCNEKYNQFIRASANFLHPNPEVLAANGGWIFRDKAFDRPVGLWIMPDNSTFGMLEHFLETLISDENELHRIAKEKVAELKADKKVEFGDHHEAKARMMTWLAWQKKPGLPYGTTLSRTDSPFNHETETVERFLEWIKAVFDAE